MKGSDWRIILGILSFAGYFVVDPLFNTTDRTFAGMIIVTIYGIIVMAFIGSIFMSDDEIENP